MCILLPILILLPQTLLSINLLIYHRVRSEPLTLLVTFYSLILIHHSILTPFEGNLVPDIM